MPKFSQYTEETAPSNDDLIVITENASGATRRVQMQNILPTGSVSSAKIADGSVTNAKLSTAAGELGGAWTTWTPTWVSVTIGNGTVSARYMRVGKIVFFKVYLLWGSTTTFSGGTNKITLPFTSTAVGGTVGPTIGSVKASDGTYQWEGPLAHDSTTTATLRWFQVQGTGIKDANLTNVAPNTWVSGNEMYISAMYEAA